MDEALAVYNRCLAIKGDWPEALVNRGNVLSRLRRLEEAVESCDRALELRPDYGVALDNRATALRRLSRFAEAAEKPIVGCSPCRLTGLTRLALAHAVAADRCPMVGGAPWKGPTYTRQDSVAWLSDSFRDTVEAQTTVELMERFDKVRFEMFGLSLSADDKSALHARLAAAFDHFIDVRAMPDDAVVKWLREREIDILAVVAGYRANGGQRSSRAAARRCR